MKKILFVVIAVIFSVIVYAQDRKMSEIKTSQLPKGVTEFISKNFPGATIYRAGKIEEKVMSIILPRSNPRAPSMPTFLTKPVK